MSDPSAPGNTEAEEGVGRGVIHIHGSFPELRMVDHRGYQSRHTSTQNFIRDTFQRYARDFIGLHFNFFIGSFDNPESCNVLAERVPYVLTYSVTPECLPNIIAMPDFIYNGWPEAGIDDYNATTAAITAAGQLPPQHNKLFWIGNVAMDPSRAVLMEMAAQNPDCMECIGMSWHGTRLPRSERLPASRYVSLPDHAAYGMLLDIRGAGYSGRLKLLMHANRPVFVVERRFREFFYDRLKPYEHYVPIRADMADLAERVRFVKDNPDLAAHLGRGAASFAAQFLTRDYALQYMRDVLLRISQKN